MSFLDLSRGVAIGVTRLKLENILKDSLDSIPSPSPSVKIQIMGGKVCLSCIGQTLLGGQQTFCFQKFVDNAQ